MGVGKIRGVAVLSLVLVMVAQCSGWQWPFWSTTEKDLCKEVCRCPQDLLEARRRGIDCVDCNITYIHEGLEISKVYTSINFARNHIGVLTPTTFSTSSTLLSLDLSDNLLKSLPARVFEPLQVLSFLVLSNNNISSLDPESFGGLNNLTLLDLSYNNLQSLPRAVFSDLGNLQELNLGFNPLATLNDSLLDHLSTLRKLDLSKLGLTSLEPNLFTSNLSSLEKLSLAYNKLHVVPSEALHLLGPSLLHLDLSGNPFSSLDAFSFYGLVNLRTLTLEQMMKLRTIEEYAFGDLVRLETLTLRYLPWIQRIDPKAFHAAGGSGEFALTLSDFTFSFSSLHTLPEDLLPWDKMHYVSMEFNHWDCDCNMRWVKNATALVRMTGKRMMCLEPERLRGHRLIHVEDEDLTCNPPIQATEGAFVFLAVVMVVGLSASLATVSLLVYWQRGWVCRRPYNGVYTSVQRTGSTITITDDVTTTSEA